MDAVALLGGNEYLVQQLLDRLLDAGFTTAQVTMLRVIRVMVMLVMLVMMMMLMCLAVIKSKIILYCKGGLCETGQ